MLLIGAILAVLILIILVLFAFPQLSPIPYYPSNSKDMNMIMKFLNFKNGQVIIDLGAGDGVVIFQAADQTFKKHLNTEFIAIETNPILVLIMFFRRALHPNKNRIHIVMSDLFKTNYKTLISNTIHKPDKKIVFYLYISPWLIKNAIKQVQKTVSQFDVVSYFYPLAFLKEKKKELGKNTIYFYTIKE